jgi:hypothetical protein
VEAALGLIGASVGALIAWMASAVTERRRLTFESRTAVRAFAAEILAFSLDYRNRIWFDRNSGTDQLGGFDYRGYRLAEANTRLDGSPAVVAALDLLTGANAELGMAFHSSQNDDSFESALARQRKAIDCFGVAARRRS